MASTLVVPDWWINATGMFAIAGICVFIASIFATWYVVRILMDLRDHLNNLNTRVEKLTDKVDAITETVKDVTTEVGSRTKGIVRIVDQHAATGFDIVEKFAPILVGAGIVIRMVRFFKRGR